METLKFTRKVTKLLEGNVSKLHDFRIISEKNRVEIKLSYKNQEKTEENWIYDYYSEAEYVLESIKTAIDKL
jgi:hypothetical protein